MKKISKKDLSRILTRLHIIYPGIISTEKLLSPDWLDKMYADHENRLESMRTYMKLMQLGKEGTTVIAFSEATPLCKGARSSIAYKKQRP